MIENCAARACPVVDAEENVVFVLVADGGQVGDGAWQVAALLAAQHAAELDLAAQRHLVHYARATQLDPTDGSSRVASRTAVSKKNNEDKAGIKKRNVERYLRRTAENPPALVHFLGRLACIVHMRPLATGGMAWSVCVLVTTVTSALQKRKTERDAIFGSRLVWA